MADIKDPENTLIIETTKGPVVIQLRPDLAGSLEDNDVVSG